MLRASFSLHELHVTKIDVFCVNVVIVRRSKSEAQVGASPTPMSHDHGQVFLAPSSLCYQGTIRILANCCLFTKRSKSLSPFMVKMVKLRSKVVNHKNLTAGERSDVEYLNAVFGNAWLVPDEFRGESGQRSLTVPLQGPVTNNPGCMFTCYISYDATDWLTRNSANMTEILAEAKRLVVRGSAIQVRVVRAH